MRVLIVEDEADLARVFRDFLVELGHEPVVVASAEAALPVLEATALDAIILDFQLPGLSGLEFLALPAVRESGVPVVAVSGVATESQARECLRLGAFEFLAKPVALRRLGDVLACVEAHALHRELARLGKGPERRRAERVPVRIPVRVATYDGAEWEGWALDLSPFGVRVGIEAALDAASTASLHLSLPDGGPPVRVASLLVRKAEEGHAFYFVNLTAEDYDRIGHFTRRLCS